MLAAIAVPLDVGDGDLHVSTGVEVNNPEAGTCHNCTCLEAGAVVAGAGHTIIHSCASTILHLQSGMEDATWMFL